jgi:hypothetical protein
MVTRVWSGNEETGIEVKKRKGDFGLWAFFCLRPSLFFRMSPVQVITLLLSVD